MKDLIRVEFGMEQKMCGRCKKSSSEYYELKTQIRFKYFDDISLVKEKVLKIIEKNFETINKFEEVDNGFELYFRSHGEVNKVSKLFRNYFLIDETRSKKLAGKNLLESKDKYRYFQSVVLINIKKGDKISIKGEEYYIKAINNNSELVLRGLINGRKEVVTYSIVKDYLKFLE